MSSIDNRKAILLIGLVTLTLAIWMMISPHEPGDSHDNEDGHNEHQEEMAKGPKGGRLLQQDELALEITIYETGVPPEFRIYAYHDGQLIPPEQVSIEMQLQRLGKKAERIQFASKNNYLRSNYTIYEPHSFEVLVTATFNNQQYTWQFESFEGRTIIPEPIANEMGIKTATIGPVTMTETRSLTGRVQLNPNKLSHVRPRFAGIVKAIRHELGDKVRAGDTLAIVQSNESLQNYHIKAPIDGEIVKRNTQIGEATGDEPLFIIADLSSVWVELDVFSRDLSLIKKGMPVKLATLDGRRLKTATIDWVSPLASHASQSVSARLTVANDDGLLLPGQFIRGDVTVSEFTVPLAVRKSALQQFRDFKVVFARFDDTYEVRMLELGRRDQDWIEVLGGIDPGTEYVIDNSYLIKADIEKSGASHDH